MVDKGSALGIETRVDGRKVCSLDSFHLRFVFETTLSFREQVTRVSLAVS